MADTKALVEAKIAGKKVMVFSKSYCPYCAMAKKALGKYIGKEVAADEYEVWEIENEPNCADIQAVLKQMTGASSVPRVFINGKFIGGGSETEAMDESGELRKLLTS